MNTLFSKLPPWINYQSSTLFLAFLGIILTAVLTSRRDKKNRIMQMKREVYLAALEDITLSVKFLLKIASTLEINDEANRTMGNHSLSMGKIQLVGSISVMKAASETQTEITRWMAKISEEKLAVVILNIQLKTKNDQFMANCKKSLDLSEKINRGEMKSTDQTNQYFDNLSAENKQLEPEMNRLRREVFRLHTELIARCAEASAAIGTHMLPMITAMRMDVETSIGKKKDVADMLSKFQTAQQKILDEAMKRIYVSISEKLK